MCWFSIRDNFPIICSQKLSKTIKFMSNVLVFVGAVHVARNGIYWGVSPKYRSVMKARVYHNTFVCVRVCMCVCVCVCVLVISAFDICTDRFLVLLVHQDSFFNPDIFVNDALENNNCIIGIRF